MVLYSNGICNRKIIDLIVFDSVLWNHDKFGALMICLWKSPLTVAFESVSRTPSSSKIQLDYALFCEALFGSWFFALRMVSIALKRITDKAKTVRSYAFCE